MWHLLWQLADSAFPAGGFPHSGGLEAALQRGFVRDETSLEAFVRHALAQCGRTALPLVAAAHDEPESLSALDRLCDVFLLNPVARRASCAQGRGFLAGLARSFPAAGIAALEDRVLRADLACHYAPVFGAGLRLLAVERREAQRLFLYVSGRGLASAAVRLGLVGPYAAQQLLAGLAPSMDGIVARSARLGPLDIAQTAPLADLYQAGHDRLYSRLFQS